MWGERWRGGEREAQTIVLADNDEHYVDARRTLREAAKLEPKAFGAGSDDTLEHVRYDLRAIVRSVTDFGASEARTLFNEALRDPRVRAHPTVQEVTRRNVGDPMAPAKLLSQFLDEDLPDDLLELVIEIHIAAYEKAQHELEQELPGMRQKFIDEFEILQRNPQHPLTPDMVSPELLRRRISEVAIMAIDPLDHLRRSMGRYGAERIVIGEFDAEGNRAGLYYNRPSFSRRYPYYGEILRHELVHVVSGRTIEAVGNRKSDRFRHSRIGMRRSTGPLSLQWLNEAITESLSQDMDGKRRDFEFGSTYLAERRIYEALTRKVPEELFLRAYFENAPAQGSPQTNLHLNDQLPHWTALIAAIEKAHDKNILVNIDRAILSSRDPRVIDRLELHERFDRNGNWEE